MLNLLLVSSQGRCPGVKINNLLLTYVVDYRYPENKNILVSSGRSESTRGKINYFFLFYQPLVEDLWMISIKIAAIY